MNQSHVYSLMLMFVCAFAFGFFVPDLLISNAGMPEEMRLPVCFVAGFAIAVLWPRPRCHHEQ